MRLIGNPAQGGLVGSVPGPRGETGPAGPAGPVGTWDSVSGKPSVIAAGADQAEARAEISVFSESEVTTQITAANGKAIAFAIALG